MKKFKFDCSMEYIAKGIVFADTQMEAIDKILEGDFFTIVNAEPGDVLDVFCIDTDEDAEEINEL